MNHFEIILNGTHNIYSKTKYENNILFVKRCWLMAITGCSETLSRCWIGWIFYGNVYSDGVMKELERIDILFNSKI
jgi:hypothetical protein